MNYDKFFEDSNEFRGIYSVCKEYQFDKPNFRFSFYIYANIVPNDLICKSSLIFTLLLDGAFIIQIMFISNINGFKHFEGMY